MTSSLLDRFMAKVVKQANGCWLWVGAMATNGYGRFSVHRKLVPAHRWIYEHTHGLSVGSLQVCHKCDVKNCVNPEHLFAGTQSDNMQDASRKKRIRGQNLTHCLRGHPFTEENTIPQHSGGRKCRICQRLNQHRYDAKRRGYAAIQESKP